MFSNQHKMLCLYLTYKFHQTTQVIKPNMLKSHSNHACIKGIKKGKYGWRPTLSKSFFVSSGYIPGFCYFQGFTGGTNTTTRLRCCSLSAGRCVHFRHLFTSICCCVCHISYKYMHAICEIMMYKQNKYKLNIVEYVVATDPSEATRDLAHKNSHLLKIVAI